MKSKGERETTFSYENVKNAYDRIKNHWCSRNFFGQPWGFCKLRRIPSWDRSCHCYNEDIDTIVIPVGGGGLITGIAVAAIRDYKEPIGGRNVALVLTGGNIDGNVLTNILSQY